MTGGPDYPGLLMKVTKTVTITESIQVSDPSVRLQSYIPDSLHRQFKATCAKNGVKMTQAIEDFVKNYVIAHQ